MKFLFEVKNQQNHHKNLLTAVKMWRFNYVPWTIDYADKCVQNEMALDEGALRAQIAELDQKIAFYEADIERSEEQSVELLADVQTLAMRYGFSCCSI